MRTGSLIRVAAYPLGTRALALHHVPLNVKGFIAGEPSCHLFQLSCSKLFLAPQTQTLYPDKPKRPFRHRRSAPKQLSPSAVRNGSARPY